MPTSRGNSPADLTLLTSLVARLRKIKTNWRWLGRLLTAGAILYTCVLLASSWPQLRAVNWQRYAPNVLLSFAVYLVSLLLQMFVWLRMLAYYHPVGWQDVRIYMQTVMLRQLPGGFWHWAGRSAMYQSSTKVSAKVVLMAGALDWCLILVTAIGAYGLFAANVALPLRLAMTVFAFIVGLALCSLWFPKQFRSQNRILDALAWILAYLGSWFAGGAVLFLLIHSDHIVPPGLLETAAIWAFAGGVSALAIIIPSGLGIREVSLTLLLQPYVPASIAMLTAIMLRFVFTTADLLWGATGTLLCRLAVKET